jgi:hypothetical protein
VSLLLGPARTGPDNRMMTPRAAGFAGPVALAMVGVLLLFAASAAAAPPTLSRGAQLDAGRCETAGRPVVNVTYSVTDSVDSGVAGNYWAFEDYAKRIQLWDEGEGAYCAVVGYDGRFTGVAGERSPGNTGNLDGDEHGTFHGGYRATVSGDLLEDPVWPTHGHAGTVDYECDIAGTCPGSVNWLEQYFQPGYDFGYEWWGWIYHGGRYGAWLNTADATSGDIG